MHFSLSVALAMLMAVSSARAAPPPTPTHAEIEAVLTALEQSGCQFNRNGSWYSGAQAQEHLHKKLEYLESKNLVKSTEDFIALGASTSSSSGKPYLVRCASSQPVESKRWLEEQLQVLRRTKSSAK